MSTDQDLENSSNNWIDTSSDIMLEDIPLNDLHTPDRKIEKDALVKKRKKHNHDHSGHSHGHEKNHEKSTHSHDHSTHSNHSHCHSDSHKHKKHSQPSSQSHSHSHSHESSSCDHDHDDHDHDHDHDHDEEHGHSHSHSHDKKKKKSKPEKQLTPEELYKIASERLVLYITVIGSFAMVEGMLGLFHTNVHLIRDFFDCLLMITSLGFSSKALDLSFKKKTNSFSFGFIRCNVLAAFVNSVYLLFSFVFGFVDNLHHMVEHWEEDSHETNQTSKLPTIHDDATHIKEMNQYLTLFTLLKLGIFGLYIYFESRRYNIQSYMQDNWFGWAQVKGNKELTLQKINKTTEWNSFRVNLYSISLVIACEFLSSMGNLWIHFICVNFGLIENVISILKGIKSHNLSKRNVKYCLFFFQKISLAQELNINNFTDTNQMKKLQHF